MRQRPSPGAELLRRLYVEEGHGVDYLMRRFHTWIFCIRRWLKEAGIELRPQGPIPLKDLNPERVGQMYASGQTIRSIAAELGFGPDAVGRAVTLSGVSRRPPGPTPRPRVKPEPDPTKPTLSDHTRQRNLARSSARLLRGMPTSELAALYRQKSTVRIAQEFDTSPASVQRLLNERNILVRRGRRKGVVECLPGTHPRLKANRRRRT